MRREDCLWFTFGLAAGAGVALLYAPRPGNKTQAMIAEKARQGQRYVKDQAGRATDLLDHGRRNVQRATKGMVAALVAGKDAIAD
jgi:gas vesicle protein